MYAGVMPSTVSPVVVRVGPYRPTLYISSMVEEYLIVNTRESPGGEVRIGEGIWDQISGFDVTEVMRSRRV
jgi:hypothetical protein